MTAATDACQATAAASWRDEPECLQQRQVMPPPSDRCPEREAQSNGGRGTGRLVVHDFGGSLDGKHGVRIACPVGISRHDPVGRHHDALQRSRRPPAAETPRLGRTTSMMGPFKFGSELLRAFLKAARSRPVGTRAPVPMEV